MKISYEWLREYVDTKLRAESIASKLTMAGHEVSTITKQGNDSIFDMEITANRADCLSHIGIAREVAAITGKRLKMPLAKIKKRTLAKKSFSVSIENKPACPRYTCRVINNVKVAPSPKWLVKRIESMGLRPVNNIVDITNFVLFETGQPLHAFDADKFLSREIVVRNARNKERITTIDGAERELFSQMLVLTDGQCPMAIAGVTGGKESEVTEKTKNIFLESAYFDAVSVRRTAFKLGLSTDSSYRFERGVDFGGILFASDRATSLICDIAKGEPSVIKDAGAKIETGAKIVLRPAYLNKTLGTNLKAVEISKILSRLGFGVKGVSELIVTVPTYRNDITRETDLTEEAARIYGYENIVPSPLEVAATTEDPRAKDFTRKRDITRNALTGSGFNEIITYSLISADTVKDAGFLSEEIVAIKNPLSKEQGIMRPSLFPSMLKTVAHNLSRQVYDIKLFELSNVYFQKEAQYNEEPSLIIAQHERPGKATQKNYPETGLFQLKGALSGLGKRLGITGLAFEKSTHPIFAGGYAAAVLSGSIMLGMIGSVNEKTLNSFDINGQLFIAELNFNLLAVCSNLKRYYKPLPRFPYSYRDVSFSMDSSVSYNEIESFFRQTGGAHLEKVKLLSEYRGKQIEKGRRALAIRMIFRSKKKTLTENEIDIADTAIREGLKEKFNAILR